MSEDQLQRAVRASLREHAASAPSVEGLLNRTTSREIAQRRRRLVGAATGTATLAVIVAAGAGVQHARSGRDGGVVAGPLASASASASDGRTRTTQPPASLPPAVTSHAPAGMQAVAFSGVQVFVPKAWKINDVRCGTPTSDTVVLGEGLPNAYCSVEAPTGITVVRVQSATSHTGRERAALAVRDTTVNGIRVLKGTGPPAHLGAQITAVVVPVAAVVVSVESPSSSLTARILGSLRLVTTDDNGCSARVDSDFPHLPAHQVESSEPLVAPGFTSVALCRYTAGRVVDSQQLTEEQASSLVAALGGLKPGVAHPAQGAAGGNSCVPDHGSGFVVRFAYPDRPQVAVEAQVQGCLLFADQGSSVKQGDGKLVAALVSVGGYDGTLVAPATGK